MICPSGYSLPYEIQRKINKFTTEEIPHKEDENTGQVHFTKAHQRYMLGLRTFDLLLQYGNLRPHVFASTGSLFRMHPKILFSKNCSLMITLYDDATYNELATGRFIFVDQDFWTVETLNAENRLQAGALATDGSLMPDDIEPRFGCQRRALEKFQGWSICFESDEIPETSQELRDFVKPYEEKRTSQRVGRPPVQAQLLMHYHRLFPYGHKGSPWKVVLAAIVSDGGPPATSATLRQALATEAAKNPKNTH